MKYYLLMELADNPVGANFYHCTENDLDQLKEIHGISSVDEISKEQYDLEERRCFRRNYHLATGHWLTEEELDLSLDQQVEEVIKVGN